VIYSAVFVFSVSDFQCYALCCIRWWRCGCFYDDDDDDYDLQYWKNNIYTENSEHKI